MRVTLPSVRGRKDLPERSLPSEVHLGVYFLGGAVRAEEKGRIYD